MWVLLNELRDFVREFEPIPVRLKNASEIKELLDLWRQGNLTVGSRRLAQETLDGGTF